MKTRLNSEIKIESFIKILSYLVGLIGFVSIYRFVDLIFLLTFISLFIISIVLDAKQISITKTWLINLFSLLLIAFALTNINLNDPVKPLVESLLVLLAIKFLDKKSAKDYMQICLLSVLIFTGSALFSLSIEFAFYLMMLILLLSLTFLTLTFFSEDRKLILKISLIKSLVIKSLIVSLITIPLTLLLFLILPRSSFPLLSFLSRETALTGFSDSIQLGKVSNIQTDDSVIMRVNIKQIEPTRLYWRGIVLTNFDGTKWSNINSENLPQQLSKIQGEVINYTIYLEPYYNKYLFFLDIPFFKSLGKITILADLTAQLDETINRRIKYEAISIIVDKYNEENLDKSKYLQLPEIKDKRLIEKVTELTTNKNDEQSALAIMNFLKNYKYSLKNLPISSSPLEDFLFTYKYGNCEYFASAMAVMLRIKGIPSRIIGGYKGGRYNNIGKYYVITQKDAHVWVEAYLDNVGWVRFDPTPPIIDSSNDIFSVLYKLRIFFDTINYYWNAMVINYDFSKQMQIVNNIRHTLKKSYVDLVNIREFSQYILFFLLTILTLTTIILLRKKIKRKTPSERILNEFLYKLKKLGYTKNKNEGLEEFAQKITNSHIRDDALIFIKNLESFIYKDKEMSTSDYKRLKSLLRNIKEK
ncbi:MAG: DUF3488 and transglutaminase-like domain-containing protein [Thermodesulfovibrionales bacterium]|nr:DUF3488 and transglutaminase-like domain-containing protein [Thermodesulfovibrionales bacterium]